MNVLQTAQFARWRARLRGPKVKARLSARLARLQDEHQQTLAFGSGYRVYYTFQGGDLVLLLTGGDESTQARDILQARALMKVIKDEPYPI